MKYAYVFYDKFIFRFEPDRMTYRMIYLIGKYNKLYKELPGHHKNGDPFSLDEMLKHSKNWNQATVRSYWLFYLQKNKERFKEFYKLFEQEGNMKHYIFFYTEHFTFRMSKGLIEAYNKETKEWGKVATYELVDGYDFKSLVGFNITNYADFMKDANGELMNFINYEKTAPRFLEFLDIIEKGVDVKDEE